MGIFFLKYNANNNPVIKPDKCPSQETCSSIGNTYQIILPYRNTTSKDKAINRKYFVNTPLKKIKLTLDPLNFKINAKTIDAKITFNNKLIELEYIQTQISLNSLIKNQLVASQIEISTKPILLKNFVSFIRSINNRPELFFLERFIKKGYLIADLKFNIDEFGALKNDYKINGLLKEGEIIIYDSQNNIIKTILVQSGFAQIENGQNLLVLIN